MSERVNAKAENCPLCCQSACVFEAKMQRKQPTMGADNARRIIKLPEAAWPLVKLPRKAIAPRSSPEVV
jgi:hypothetical protein